MTYIVDYCKPIAGPYVSDLPSSGLPGEIRWCGIHQSLMAYNHHNGLWERIKLPINNVNLSKYAEDAIDFSYELMLLIGANQDLKSIQQHLEYKNRQLDDMLGKLDNIINKYEKTYPLVTGALEELKVSLKLSQDIDVET